MWPKAFAQFVELAPHISRLLPMADRFFQSKSAGDDANRRAVESLAEDLRGGLAQITAANTDLARQLTALSEGVTEATAEAHAARGAAEALQARLTRLEGRQQHGGLLPALTLVLLAIIVILLIVILVRGH